MTETGSSIWRDDEGQASQAPPESSGPGPDLFGSSAPPQPAPSTRDAVDLWRSDEGKPTHQVHLPTAPAEPSRRKRKKRAKKQRQRLISWPVVVFVTLVLLLLAVAVDAGVGLMTIRDRLAGVAAELNQVETLLGEGNLDEAAASAGTAIAEADSAEEATGRPSLLLASMIPEVRREADALDGAVEAAVLSAEAARSVVAGASALGLDEEGVPSALYVDGQVQLATIAEARQDINEAELALTAALLRLEELDPRLEQLSAPIEDARSRVSGALARITDARTSMDLVSSLFGARGERRYLLAFQSPSEARGTGGLVGLAAVLNANEGRLELSEPAHYTEFAPRRPRNIDAPAWFRDSYGPQQALRQWPQANVSPNHPVVAEVLLEMYEAGTGEGLDGVVTMDPLAMQELMVGVDSIEIENPSTVIDSSNVAEVLLHDSYTEFETPDEQNLFLAAVVDAFWSQVTDGDVDLERFAEGLGKAVGGQHLKLFARGSDQRNIEALNLDGDYAFAPNSQMVFNVNYAANKVDYFLHRDQQTEIGLGSGGDAQVTTTLRLENRAPAGPASPLLGQDNGLDPGTNRMTINLLMPPGSVVGAFSVGGEQREPFTYTDDDSPVVWDVLQIPPGGDQTVSLTYSIPNALQVLGGATTFDFSLYPQATVNPDTFSLTISPPPGTEVVATEGGISIEDAPSLSGELEEPISIRLFMEED